MLSFRRIIAVAGVGNDPKHVFGIIFSTRSIYGTFDDAAIWDWHLVCAAKGAAIEVILLPWTLDEFSDEIRRKTTH